MDEEMNDLLAGSVKGLLDKVRFLSVEEAEVVSAMNLAVAVILASHPLVMEDVSAGKDAIGSIQGMMASLIAATERRVKSGMSMAASVNGN